MRSMLLLHPTGSDKAGWRGRDDADVVRGVHLARKLVTVRERVGVDERRRKGLTSGGIGSSDRNRQEVVDLIDPHVLA